MKSQLRVIIALLLLLAVAGVSLGSATPARADEPQPFEYAMTRCSGFPSALAVHDVRKAFDAWYGAHYQLTTDAAWQWSYVARVNEFAASVGCPPPLEDNGTKSGRLTFAYRVYAPWFLFYAHKVAME